MTPQELLQFLRLHRLAVESSVARSGASQSAVVGIAIGESFELVFDTLASSRKAENLRLNPRASFVIGGLEPGDERSAQVEGIADFPEGDDLRRAQQLYFSVWPDGRERARTPQIVHVRVRPTWIRYSDFTQRPPLIAEFSAAALGSLKQG